MSRELVYLVAVSLDGFIAAPDGGTGAFPVEADLTAHLARHWADSLPTHVHAALGAVPDGSRFDTVVMGWNTYTPALAAGIESPYAHLRQLVVGSPRRRVGAGVELVHEPVAVVRALKAEAGAGIYLAGGGRLAGALLEEVDRLVLKVNPLLLGDGVPLFGRRGHDPRAFALQDRHALASGVTVLELVPRR